MNKRRGGTPVRTVRVHGELWEPAQAIAKLRGEFVSEAVLVPAIERYVRKHRHLLDTPESGDAGAPPDPLP